MPRTHNAIAPHNPDNTKTAVKHPCRYELELNPTYRELAEHYGFAVVPARPYKPRDKAKVVAGVRVARVLRAAPGASGDQLLRQQRRRVVRAISNALKAVALTARV